jgi:hypothetical protein
MDTGSQPRHVTALVVRIGTWLRDEEASRSVRPSQNGSHPARHDPAVRDTASMTISPRHTHIWRKGRLAAIGAWSWIIVSIFVSALIRRRDRAAGRRGDSPMTATPRASSQRPEPVALLREPSRRSRLETAAAWTQVVALSQSQDSFTQALRTRARLRTRNRHWLRSGYSSNRWPHNSGRSTFSSTRYRLRC